MDNQNISKSLLEQFEATSKTGFPYRILLWRDVEGSFREEIDQIAESLQAHDIVTLKMDCDNLSHFMTKKRIEIDEPEQKFLLYFTSKEPPHEEDWFLDTRLYSYSFHADKAALVMVSLGLNRMVLREHIAKREAFLANKRRVEALKRFVVENDDETSLDLKMIAVTVKAKNATIETIVLQLFKAYVESEFQDDFKVWKELESYQLLETLWRVLQEQFGYFIALKNRELFGEELASSATLHDFLLKLFCTELDEHLMGASESKGWFQANVIKQPSGRATSLAFLANWRDRRAYSDDYQQIEARMSVLLGVEEKFTHYNEEELIQLMAFERAEQVIVQSLMGKLLSYETLNAELFERVINQRIVGYWVSVKPVYGELYQALLVAKQFLDLQDKHHAGFKYSHAHELFTAYSQHLYLFDQYYRQYMVYALKHKNEGRSLLQSLTDKIEKLYINWYGLTLNREWDRLLEADQLMKKWQLSNVPKQERFFTEIVQKELKENNLKRIYVIISDALRYEVAQSLTDAFNSDETFNAEISPQLGVLPSYTQLGMAALLPHDELGYAKDGAVLADGLSTQGLEKRNDILKRVNGVAFKADLFQGFTREEEREQRLDAEYIYIYHDEIDAVGDKAATESKTFNACSDAIDQLLGMTRKILNTYNGSRVIITADHGFVFQQPPLDELDRTELKLTNLEEKPVIKKKRYVVSHTQVAADNAWFGPIREVVSTFKGDEYFITPKAWQRFHFTGGAQFIHGGASLQEICVPVISVRNRTQRSREIFGTRRLVEAVSIDTKPRIVNNTTKIELLQTEWVSDTVLPRTIDVYIVDEAGEKVSNQASVRLDSTVENKIPRERSVMLSLIGNAFDRSKKYKLILEDNSSRVEIATYPIVIDLIFGNEFF